MKINKDELVPNQKYEDQGADTWEESQSTTTDEVKCDQTWTSDVNLEANMWFPFGFRNH
ncbi:hypothetical protein HanHA300_Chr07g0234901 [Helianthus annuus]|nr:hypothetical protein HanHA300_Chr07g0234901 [Helianthus annuus]KAJ0562490.1 hypothetical protein HanHA89_Chr07g0252081 [Helianthus annuus]KAJ0727866.1 hypothetical protein HanLR1_Chr07g0234851 [Helianthus annuus]